MSNVVEVLEQTQKATIVKFTDNHALVRIASGNAFSTEDTYCYVNKSPLADMPVDAEFDLPAGKLVTKTNQEGDVMTTTTGIPLKFYSA